MSVLITGGAGYIGSHTVVEFLDKGEDVIVLDNLSKGHLEAVQTDKFYQGDIGDYELLDKIFQNNNIESVIHFAADSLVGESVLNPLKYYENNVCNTQKLLIKMKEYNIKKIVFSSSAAVYGESKNLYLTESDITLPTNPYGETKLAIEKMLKWCDQAYGIKYIALRYFNAAGAHPNSFIGEDHDQESHLIPLVLQVPLNKRKYISIFGDKYPTNDGTCIRDYIHVMDLANAHWLALQKLSKDNISDVYNLGNGKGFSVKEVIISARKITGHDIPEIISENRIGDPALLVADSSKAKEKLNWKPQFNKLDNIIYTAWKWHKNNPNGFKRQ